MLLEIISPETCLFTGEVISVSFPGTEGRFEIRPGHAPMIAALKAGEIGYETATGQTVCRTAGGFVEILGDRITACVEQASAPPKKEAVPPQGTLPSK